MIKLNSVNDETLRACIEQARALTFSGSCCPRSCGVNRAFAMPPCGAIEHGARVMSFSVHKGEEPPVSGENGAGNVFFSGCSLGCVFCQNYPFSHMNHGKDYSPEDLAEKIITLVSKRKVHNINFVTGDHYLLSVLESLTYLKGRIDVPIISNCSGFFTKEHIRILDVVADIFLFDLKYSDENLATSLSCVKNYVEKSFSAVEHFLDNPLKWVERDGLLKSGLVIRHLVLPGKLENTKGVLIKAADLRDRGLDFKFSLMCQFFPAFKSGNPGFEFLNRKLEEDEYDQALLLMDELGLDGWCQDFDASGGC